MWYVYILLSTVCDRTYTGVTTDVDSRVRAHNGVIKGGAKATRANRPWKVIHKETSPNRSLAQKREAQIKRLSLLDKRKLAGIV